MSKALEVIRWGIVVAVLVAIGLILRPTEADVVIGKQSKQAPVSFWERSDGVTFVCMGEKRDMACRPMAPWLQYCRTAPQQQLVCADSKENRDELYDKTWRDV